MKKTTDRNTHSTRHSCPSVGRLSVSAPFLPPRPAPRHCPAAELHTLFWTPRLSVCLCVCLWVCVLHHTLSSSSRTVCPRATPTGRDALWPAAFPRPCWSALVRETGDCMARGQHQHRLRLPEDLRNGGLSQKLGCCTVTLWACNTNSPQRRDFSIFV